MDLKKVQPLTLEWLDQQFPDFFERYGYTTITKCP